jgi:hypothetical protein
MKRIAIVVAFVVGSTIGFGSAFAGGDPNQCPKNCKNQHCPRGKCSDDQHQKRLDACLAKCK